MKKTDSDRNSFFPGSRQFKDFTALSRKILYYANQGTPRIEFLKEISKMLLDFTGCCSLELWMNDVELTYRWEASLDGAGEHFFDVEILKESGDTPSVSDYRHLCAGIIRGAAGSDRAYFSQHGIFFTHPVPGGDGPHETGSIALLPFYVADGHIGLLSLKSCNEHHFNSHNIDFYEGAAQTLGIAIANRRAQAALKERIKELRCLYDMCQVFHSHGLPLSSILRRVVNLLPPAMQYPEAASARIIMDGEIYRTAGLKEEGESLTSEIRIKNEIRGMVEVIYRMQDRELELGVFLSEEKSLLDTIAQNLALIIERKQADEEKARLEQQLRHADRLATIGQLAAGVAHELNEPIGNILGFGQLAQKTGDLPEQTQKDLDRIINASLQAREIVKKLLIFARQMPQKKSSTDINFLIEDILSFFESRFEQERITVKLMLEGNLPMIMADLSQIRQVLVNLIVNAMQAMKAGGTLVIETASIGDQVSIAVSDSGVGMNDAVLKKIFVPFFTTKRVGQGTGLGLSVAHGIIASHNGTITVRSRPGQGSLFEVILPVSGTGKPV